MLLKLGIAFGVVVAVAALLARVLRRGSNDQVLSESWRRERIRRG